MNAKTTRTFLRTIRKNRRHTLRRHILCAGIASLLLLPGHAAGVLLHDYQFSGTFADSLGGPALVPLGGTGTFSATNYSFAAGQGLSLSSGLPAAGDYSIVADFSFASPSGYRKIVDFKTQTSDTGLYSLGSSLNFFPVTTGPSGTFASNVALNLALTRDGATSQVTGYVNGAQHITFTDAGSLAVFNGANNEIRFFIDDNATGGSEASAGVVDRVRIFNGALTPAQLAALLAAPAPATFWKGTTDGTWTSANWASDAAGTPTSAIPNATSDITFSATGAMNQTTTLGADFTIHSLTISDSAAVTINSGTGGPRTLTLAGAAGTGLDVQTGAGLVTIGANITLGGSSDTITVNNTAGAVINGSIGGTNGLIKQGAGTLTLAGLNTYTGGTTVATGTLRLGDGIHSASLGTGAVNVNGGTTTGAGGGNLRFYDHSSAGDAALTANGGTGGGGGGSIWFLGSATGTTGAVTVNGNASLDLSLSFGGVAVGSLAGDGYVFLAPSTLTVGSNNQSTTFSGTIRDDGYIPSTGGSLTKVGTGTLTLNGTNTYTGATTVNGGSLIAASAQALGLNSAVSVNAGGILDLSLSPGGVAIGSLAGDGIVALAPSTLTVGGNNQSTTFSGTIRDDGYIPSTGGSLAKVGTGTLTLTGANTYTGSTTLSAGTLAAGNVKAFGNGNLTLMGGTLKTTGGPLAVDIGAGNILFGGGTYVATVGGTAPGVTHDQLKTTGSANIGGGTLALVPLNGFHLMPGQKIALLSAAGGVAGGTADGTKLPAANVTGLSAFSDSPLLVPVVNLYTASVVLEAMQGSFGSLAATLGLTPNQIAIAGALDSLLAQTGGKTGVIKELDFLDSLPSSQIAANLDLLNPAALTSAFNLSGALANVQSANIQQRLASVRGSDSGGGDASGTPGGGGANGPKGARGNAVAPANEDRWGLWMTGSGNFIHIGSATNGAGLNLNSGGVTAGVDYRFTDHFAAGISIGYMNTDASLPNGGKMEVDGGRIGAYATYFNRGLHLDASVSGGPNGYTTRRTTPGNTSATASPRGTEVNVLFAAGYDWKWKALTLGPTASLQYSNVQLDGFTERGAFAPLRVAAQDSESLRTSLGFHVALDKKIGRAVLRPEVRAAWQHECGDASHSLTASFATLGGAPFTVTGPATGRDSMLLSAGFSVQWNARFATYAYYDAELFRTNYSSNNVSVGFRWQF